MKRKLIAACVLLSVGAYAPDLREHAAAWWSARPSTEAQRLIDSLHGGDGWSADKSYVHDGRSVLEKGQLRVRTAAVFADIFLFAKGAEISSSFSLAERREINRAAENCLRVLAVREIDSVTAAEK